MTHLVVFIAGAGQDSRAWDEQVARLHGRPVLAVAPSDLATPFSFEAALGGLDERIRAAGASSVTLIGLSIGGMIATRYAAANPDRVTGLLLSGSQIRPNAALMRVQRAVLRAIPGRALPLPAGLDKTTFLSLLDAAAGVDLRADVPRIHAPALVLCGSKDRANLPAARALAATLPDAALRIVPGGGHDLAADAPDDVADAVRTLLERTAPA
ncbi:alpha/beta fold hydrolase [Sediminivirga luteola]|uniref:Hydrolase n=1 Tax=Sediminivirga luteola TaxID=1774748 RepID=A0A8J2XKC2_9MICO|nr:alpha/beta fold hydrolase [Sediminivirga luteola]GGA08432.1 hydrolase [Sediminivirga luteola]